MGVFYPRKEIDSLLRLRVYENRDALFRGAFRALLELKPSLGVEAAVDIYRRGEVSLWAASEIAGLNLEEFKEILSGKGVGVEVSSTAKESDRRLEKVYGASN